MARYKVTAATVGLSGRFEEVQVVTDEAQTAKTPWAVDLDAPDTEKVLEPSF